ncbi:MAG: hypothetical protein Fur0037_20890 [Planctomycetota bacterium]
MTSCARCRDRIPEFVAGELTGPKALALRGHLMSCIDCRREASAHLRAHGALRSLRDESIVGEEFFEDLHRSILAAIQDSRPGAEGTRSGGPWRHRLQRASGLLAAMALFALGIWTVRFSDGREPPGRGGERAGVPALPLDGGPVLRELGSFAEGIDPALWAPSLRGMMGRAMLPRFVEVDLLGLGTMTLRADGGEAMEEAFAGSDGR